MTQQDRDLARIQAVRRLTRALDVPMALLSLVFLGLVVADLAAPPDAPYRDSLDRISLAIWGLFVLEFLIKLAIAPARLTYLRRGWFDILVLIVPMFRVLRALRLVRSLRVLRFISLFRLGSAMRRGAQGMGRFFRKSRFGYVSALTAVVAFVGAAGMLFLERDAAHSQIRTYEDALWWSASLLTTVASDLQPVTGPGRVLAVAMMLYAVVVFGYLVSHAVAFIQGSPDRKE